MSDTCPRLRLTAPPTLSLLLALAVWMAGSWGFSGPAFAQETGSGGQPAATNRRSVPVQTSTELDDRLREAQRRAEAAVARDEANQEEQAVLPSPIQNTEMINFLELLILGGWLMVPIALMSLLVVAAGAERFLGLRRRRVLPPRLVTGLRELADQSEGFDPRQAYKLCREYPSPASKVIQAMLLKVGRPHSELEHAISQASQREAVRLNANVRWLTLAAGVTPLLGLLGTVWGMILAFFQTANLPVEANRAQVLADGIWTALVTTFAGLSVAIPAAVLAHYFEGRIQKLFLDLDEALSAFLPQLERYEGRLRLSQDQLERPDGGPPTAAAEEGRKQQKPAASRKTTREADHGRHAR